MATGVTPTYSIPFPLFTDPVDVHGDMEDLANRVEDILETKVAANAQNLFSNTNTFEATSSSPVVRIIQNGAGNALEVRDQTSDSTYFLVNADGNVGIGKTSASEKLDVTGNINVDGVLLAGSGSRADFNSSAYTNPIAVFGIDADDYAQVAFKNSSDGNDASTDIIVYSDNGVDAAGYMDMGITSSTFDDPDFTITGPNDGYIFMTAPEVFTETVTNKALTGNVATLTIGANDFRVGMPVTVSGVDSTFNGTYTITARTSTTFSYAKEADNVTSTSATGTAVAGTTGAGNLVIATGDTGTQNKIVFAAGGLASDDTQMSITPNEGVHIDIDTQSTDETNGSLVVAGGVGIAKDLHIAGDLHPLGSVHIESEDGEIHIGPDAHDFALTLTNPAIVVTQDANDYAQIAFQNVNNGADASADFIAYADNGDDDSGYIDMGITSSAFADPLFTVTGPNDGYIFMVAPGGTTGNGDLILATGDTGERNAIVFAAGGLASNNTQMVITPDVNVHVEIDTPSDSPTTGAFTVVGGVGILGDMNVQGNVNINGTITFGGGGTTVETANLNVTDPAIFIGTGSASVTTDLSFVGEYPITISTITKAVSNKAYVKATDLATLTAAAHTFQVGDTVEVADVDTDLDGTFQIYAITTDTFSYKTTTPANNISSTAVSPAGSAVVSLRRRFFGITRDAADGVVKLFHTANEKPTTNVNFSDGTIAFAPLKAGSLELTTALAIAQGGTGHTTASDAINALVPSQTGNTGEYLTTNGTSVSWATVDALPPLIEGSVIECQTAFSLEVVFSERSGTNWIIYADGPAFSSQDIALMNSTFPVGTVITVTDGTDSQTFTVNSLFVSSVFGMSTTTVESSDFNNINSPTTFDSTVLQAGKYLTNDGTTASWGVVDILPTQTSNSGKFLTTNGTVTAWADISGGIAQDSMPTTEIEGQIWLDTNGTTQPTAVELTRWTKTVAEAGTTFSGTGDESTTLSYSPSTEQVYLNGVMLVRGSDYTAASGTSIILGSAAQVGDTLQVLLIPPVNVATVINNSFVNAKGDIVTASADNTPAILSADTDGLYLKLNSSTATGLQWAAVPDPDLTSIEIKAIMGVF